LNQQTTVGLVGYLFIGMAAVLLPSIMPSITAEFVATGLTLAAIGLIFPASAGGAMLGNLLSGIASDWLGRRLLVWLSALSLAAALALAASTRYWLLFVIGYILVSACQGSLSTSINALIADANQGARARALNILHGVYGVGAAISPLAIGYLLEQGVQWRWALGGASAIWLLYGIFAYLLGRGEAAPRQSSKKQARDFSLLRQGSFLALFLIAFIYNGVAWSLLGWIGVFMQQSAGFSLFLSVSMISIFYIALMIGRFLCAAYAEKLGYAVVLLILGIGITLTYPLVLMGNSQLVVVGVFLTGLSLSGLFPTALAYGARLFPEQTGTVSGTLSIAMTLGSMVPPLWTGVVAGIGGIQLALGVNYLLVPPLILLALYLGRREHSAAVDHQQVATDA
jgi:FHS family glucose/mannose:H+ symporter-like MFS transporter